MQSFIGFVNLEWFLKGLWLWFFFWARGIVGQVRKLNGHYSSSERWFFWRGTLTKEGFLFCTSNWEKACVSFECGLKGVL